MLATTCNLAELFPFTSFLGGTCDLLMRQANRVTYNRTDCVVDTSIDRQHEYLLYLLEGELQIRSPAQPTILQSAHSQRSRYPLNLPSPRPLRAEVISDEAVILQIPRQQLERLAVWDQLVRSETLRYPTMTEVIAQPQSAADHPHWLALADLPACIGLDATVIETLIQSFEPSPWQAGQIIFEAGDRADHLYLIEQGVVSASMIIDELPQLLAYLPAGSCFGEQALTDSYSKYDSTMRMVESGQLWRISAEQFRQVTTPGIVPALINFALAAQQLHRGSVLLDVRMPEEFTQRAIEGSINIPLSQLRSQAPLKLPLGIEILVYCNSGQRSSAAAVILESLGYRAQVLAGGISAMMQQIADRSATNQH